MNANRDFEVAIVGGGLAGLALSIQLARKNHRVVLFEKEKYPFHKVCGEYISMESWDFLSGLGLPLDKWDLPKIHSLNITSPRGKTIRTALPLGGFGISRYKLDAAMAEIAKSTGVQVFENTKVQDISFENDKHHIQTSAGVFITSAAAACYGKKANLDVKWKRNFLYRNEKENYVGVKYHVRSNLSRQQISLHNFDGGYCGISAIEDNRFCLCYLTNSENLKKNRQSIPDMEENVLKQNPALRELLNEVTVLFDEPITIAQISFAKKTQIENHVLCIGDAAGMITPLCGNGMSMALHGSKIAFESINRFLTNHSSREQMENTYRNNWNRQFAKRLKTGRIIQHFFGNPFWSSFLLYIIKPFPLFLRMIVRQTHGKRF